MINEDLFELQIVQGETPFTELDGIIEEFGKFTIGNDDDENEMILFPGSFDFKFNVSTYNEFVSVMSALVNVNFETEMNITKNGVSFFKAILDRDSLVGEPSAWELGIEASFVDDYDKLQETFTRPTFPYNDFDFKIFWIIKNSLGIDYLETEILTDFRFRYIIGGITNYAYMEDVGFSLRYRLNQSLKIHYGAGLTREENYYLTAGDVFKSVLNNFASYGVIGLNRKFYLVPRFYNGQELKRLDNDNTYEENNSMTFMKNFKGMRAIVAVNDGLETDYIELTYGSVEYGAGDDDDKLKYPAEVETIYIPAPLNFAIEHLQTYPPRMPVHPSLFVWDELGVRHDLEYDSAAYKLESGAYSAEKSLIEWATSLIWNTIKIVRKKLIVKATGTDYSFSDFFQYFDDAGVYRPLKITYDFVEQETELILIECASVDEFIPEIPVVWGDPYPGDGTLINGTVINESLDPLVMMTAYEFEFSTTRLFRNGARLKLVNDYTEEADHQSITLVIAGVAGENILIDYTLLT
ncbi:MAG: hypothetical protein NUV65_05930 [Candidatus Roizmanbacteria bacterium]|nr:hypothetical protein [Candidatus Roizmanbacteria bacterium]